MEHRALGRTALKTSIFGIGTWQLSGPLQVDGLPDGYPDPGEGNVLNLIAACRDLGINLIDTAEIYGDGEGERRVGEAIRNDRSHWIISSKFGLRRGPDGARVSNSRPETIVPSLEGSLRRLKTDYIDIYLYHSPPRDQEIEQGTKVLHQLQKEGKIRFFGISTNDATLLRKLQHYPGHDVVLYSMSLLRQARKIRKLVHQHALGGLVHSVLEGGRLTGDFLVNPPVFPKEDIRSRTFLGADLQSFGRFEQLSSPNHTIFDLALRYVLDFETTHSIILGARAFEGYRRAIRVLKQPPLDSCRRVEAEKIGIALSTPPHSLSSVAAKMLRRLHLTMDSRLVQ
jgi:aryl-alcohol dehydrogenase-like predicted oxidoreductase